MNFMNRAWLYIVRKRGKSILLFVILLVMATFVLTALALGNASKAAQQELRQSLGGSFLIGFDYTENNPYLKVESVDGGTLIYSTQQIRPELVEQIREIEGIKECSATVEGLAAFPSLELFTGNIPIEEEFRASSKILSAWKSEELTRFTSGQLTLTEGRHILPDDKNKGLISKDLAEKNGLKIGDKIQTDKGVEIEIVGLFSPKEIEGINDQVTTYDTLKSSTTFRGLSDSGLKTLVPQLFHVELPDFETVTAGRFFDELDPQDKETVRYACADSDFALRLYYAKSKARERFLDAAEFEPPSFQCFYEAENWTENSLLSYILDSQGYTAKEATDYMEGNQEEMLFDFLCNDVELAEYQALVDDRDNPVHIVKKIMAAMNTTSAKTVNVTICKDGEEFSFKTEAQELRRDCKDYYSTWNIFSLPRRAMT